MRRPESLGRIGAGDVVTCSWAPGARGPVLVLAIRRGERVCPHGRARPGVSRMRTVPGPVQVNVFLAGEQPRDATARAAGAWIHTSDLAVTQGAPTQAKRC